ncbi:helix-hairpin-helix domain-containing protein [Methanohalobium sp.]|uniref:MutS-related protein n=1 Tax=Methanohalobium sp. TaxID=2837493 RepID=UPI0025CDFDF5|nr:helix-hairpin-helix domain-containing protein [Methanohalobium sp.]
MESLQDVPRIGDKTAQRFIGHFGSEEAALNAILNGDIASISEIEGIGQKFAISLVHETRGIIDGVTLTDFLKTNEAINIYERLLDVIKQFANTGYARDKLHIYIPYPSSKMNLIKQIQDTVNYYRKTADVFGKDDKFLKMLSYIKPLKSNYPSGKIRDRTILTTDENVYANLKKKYGSFVDIQIVTDSSEMLDIARGYSHAITDDYLDVDYSEDMELEYVTDLEKLQDWQIIPEKEIAFYAKNLPAVENSLDVIQCLRSNDFNFFEQMNNKDLDILRETLELIDENGDVATGTDPEIDRLGKIHERIDETVSKTVEDANAKLDKCLEESKMTLSGQDMLRVMNGSMEIQDLMRKEIYQSYQSILEEAKDSITDELKLEKQEKLFVDSLFPDEISYPIEIDDSQVNALKQDIVRRIQKKKVEHKRQISKTLHEYHDIIRELVYSVLDFDVGFAIGRFASEYNLEMPQLIDGAGIGFVKGRNLFLQSKYGDVTPIDYSLGKTSHNSDNNRHVLLSGVNSGGKTSMLELLAQCVILAHMGFPVPANVPEIGLTDGLYYFAKSKGTLDAGAFESTLTDFSVVTDNSSKVVLVDELESITEPGASAKIIAGILETLSKNEKSMSVFVSHLSELIMENTQCDVRVDGIEAEGLDSELNLIVDRTPRQNYIAKSTPELIVERLARKTSGDEQAFYNRLKNKFD